MEVNWRDVHDIEQSPLLFPILPVLLPLEILVLVWQEWVYYRDDVDRQWMEDGDFWSGRIAGLQAQDLFAWGSGALVGVAYWQESYVRLGVYLLLAFLVMRFKHRIRWGHP